MSWKKEAIKLDDEGNISWRKIAKKLGVPKSTVSDFLRARKKLTHPYNMLFIDIETSMILAYVWDIWKQNVHLDAIVEDWYILCFSAAWLHTDKVISHSCASYTGTDNMREGEPTLVAALWKLLDTADIVCAYNGKKFDKRRINAKFLEYGYPEPSPYQFVDPYLIIKGNFDLTSNKLDYVAKLLEQEGKHKTGIDLWLACMAGDRFAMATMQEYCDNDVTELKDVYHKLKHWDKNHPNVALFYEDESPRCNTCGSTSLSELEGAANTTVSSFSVLRCDDCGTVLRDRVSTVDKNKRKNLYVKAK